MTCTYAASRPSASTRPRTGHTQCHRPESHLLLGADEGPGQSAYQPARRRFSSYRQQDPARREVANRRQGHRSMVSRLRPVRVPQERRRAPQPATPLSFSSASPGFRSWLDPQVTTGVTAELRPALPIRFIGLFSTVTVLTAMPAGYPTTVKAMKPPTTPAVVLRAHRPSASGRHRFHAITAEVEIGRLPADKSMRAGQAAGSRPATLVMPGSTSVRQSDQALNQTARLSSGRPGRSGFRAVRACQ